MPRLASSVATALTAASTAIASPVIINLGQLTGPGGPCGEPIINTMSPDGSTLAGDGRCTGFRWDNTLGIQNLGALMQDVSGLSSNGSIAAGYALFGPNGEPRAARLLPGNVSHIIGTLAGYNISKAYACSHDGSVVTGELSNEPGGNERAFRWEQATGLQILPLPPSPIYTRGLVVSADKSVIFGYGFAIPSPHATAYRWKTGFPAQALPNLPGTYIFVPAACDAAGNLMVGYGRTTDFGFYRAARWTSDGTEELPYPASASGALASDMSSAGIAIVGTVFYGTGNNIPRAAVWTDNYGWTDLNTLLPELGVNLNGWLLTSCANISDDGTVISGQGFIGFTPVAWMVRGIPPLCGPRIDLQPVNTAKCAYSTAGITSIASPPNSTAIMSRQWYKRVPQGTGYIDVSLTNGATPFGSTFSGAQSSNLTITNLALPDAGEYFCRHSGGCGSIDTHHITLTVLPNLSASGGPIGTADLVLVLGNFGENVPPWTSGDVNGDGVVNTADLTYVLGFFGQPCP